MTSHFMKACAENPDGKLMVSQMDYKLFLGDKAHPDDVPQAVLCLPIFDTQKILAGVLEVRNQGKKQFVDSDEEQLAAVTAQSGVQFTNLLCKLKASLCFSPRYLEPNFLNQWLPVPSQTTAGCRRRSAAMSSHSLTSRL